MRRTRFRVGFAIVFLGLVASFFLFLDLSDFEPLIIPEAPISAPTDSSELILTATPPQNITSQQPVPPVPKDPWCKPDECASGRWEPRQPPFTTIEQFQGAYANRIHQLWKGCHAIPSTKPRTPEELDKANEDRLMKVMNWTWTPNVGNMKPWDADEFVIRLLRSPGGLILVGGTSSSLSTTPTFSP
jgi:hypothetical protein